MKRILLLFVFLPAFAFSQTLVKDPVTTNYKIDTVINADLKKEALYSNSLRWISSNFKDSRNVIESKDVETGEVTFKGHMSGYAEVLVKKKVTFPPVDLHFTGKVITKDGKYRLIMSDLFFTYITPTLKTGLRPSDKTLIPDDPYNKQALKMLGFLTENLIYSMAQSSDQDF